MQKIFISCIESKIYTQNEVYARYHIGNFVSGEALTFANALRRTLLSKMPGLVVTSVKYPNADYEFTVLPGVQETILDISLNLSQVIFQLSLNSPISQSTSFVAYLDIKGPARVTAADLTLPHSLRCVNPTAYIATLNETGRLMLTLSIQLDDHSTLYPKHNNAFQMYESLTYYVERFSTSMNKDSFFAGAGISLASNEDPHYSDEDLTYNKFRIKFKNYFYNQVKKGIILYLNTVATPVFKINYVIKESESNKKLEFIDLEVLTDGSLHPTEALGLSLEKLTNLFFNFLKLTQNDYN